MHNHARIKNLQQKNDLQKELNYSASNGAEKIDEILSLKQQR